MQRYFEPIINLWPDYHTKYHKNSVDNPVRFYATVWMVEQFPSEGRLYIRHLCRIKRYAKRRNGGPKDKVYIL